MTLSTTALSLKAKSVAGALANVAGTTLNVAGTSGVDAIAIKSIPGLLYATVNGKTSVFADRPLTGVTVKVAMTAPIRA